MATQQSLVRFLSHTSGQPNYHPGYYNWGTICKKAIEVDKGTLTLKSGTIEVSGDYGIYVSNDGHAAVNGGAISSLYAPFTGNNLTRDMNFTVTDGTLTAKYGPAIYMPGQGKLDISGGTLNGGISLRMGQVNISGGTINATTGSIDSPTGSNYHYSGNAWCRIIVCF